MIWYRANSIHGTFLLGFQLFFFTFISVMNFLLAFYLVCLTWRIENTAPVVWWRWILPQLFLIRNTWV